MKKINFVLFSLFISVLSFAQPSTTKNTTAGKIILANGQKIVIENTSDIEASFSMGMDLNSNSVTVNSLEVKNRTDKDYTLSNTLTKIKVSMNMMGQTNNYDSETKESNNADMAKIFDERLNKPVDITIDNTTGNSVNEKKKEVKPDPEEDSNPADNLMKMFSDNSDDASVSGAFEIIPQGKSVGDSWSDTTISKDLKVTRTYLIKSITGNEAFIQMDMISKTTSKLNLQEMEFEIKSESKTKSEIITNITTGLVKKRTNNSDISGSIQMMGQDMPITAKVTSTSIYN